MRKSFKNIITPEEALEMREQFPAKFFSHIADYDRTSSPVNKILDLIENEFGIILPPSYMKAEVNSVYDWHVDTGNNNHMPWCTHGCSLLLSEDFEGGLLEYRDVSHRSPYELFIHSRDVEHRVTETTKGERHVFLMFLRIGVGML